MRIVSTCQLKTMSPIFTQKIINFNLSANTLLIKYMSDAATTIPLTRKVSEQSSIIKIKHQLFNH